MVELHWIENTSFVHFGRPGLLMLGYDPDKTPNSPNSRLFPSSVLMR